jgi:effector-binding domain-containing protein
MAYEITVEERSESPALSVRFTCDPGEIGEKLAEVLPRVHEYIADTDATPDGAPFTRYHRMSEAEWEVDAGIPVSEPVAGKDDIDATILPAGEVAKTVHRGAYEDIGEAHEAVADWIEQSDWQSSGARWDSYVDDPSGSDPDDVRTFVFWPVEEA